MKILVCLLVLLASCGSGRPDGVDIYTTDLGYKYIWYQDTTTEDVAAELDIAILAALDRFMVEDGIDATEISYLSVYIIHDSDRFIANGKTLASGAFYPITRTIELAYYSTSAGGPRLPATHHEIWHALGFLD